MTNQKQKVLYRKKLLLHTSTLSCFLYLNTYPQINLLLIQKKMIDTDYFIENMIMKAMPDIDDEGLEMMIEDTKPVLYDRVMTHIVGQIKEEDGQ